MASSQGQLQSIFGTLSQCRTALVENGDIETAELVSVAILQLRMKLHHVSDADLKALCDAMLPPQAARVAKPSRSPRRPPPAMLRLVK